MSILDASLNVSPVDYKTRAIITETYWPPKALPAYLLTILDWSPYFRYYERQTRDALVDRGRFAMVKTHQDVLSIIHQFKSSPRDEIRGALKKEVSTPNRPNEAEAIDGAIDLAARLYSMVNIAIDTRIISEQTRLRWESGTLENCIKSHFREPQILSDTTLRLEENFTAANLECITGIRVVPTDNLADHLRLTDRDSTVAIFCNVSFLRRHVSVVFPDGLIDETLRTLSLLFPVNDKRTQKWLRKNVESSGVDSALSSCELLRFEERQFEGFRFWHDRLVILKQAFDQSRPSTISQWWHDRRNGVQWYTFWVAILVLFLTIFFGLVQSIEGALQVYKAYHPS